MSLLSVLQNIERYFFGMIKAIFFPENAPLNKQPNVATGLLNSKASLDLYHDTLLPKKSKSNRAVIETVAVLILLICLLNFSL